MYPTWKFTMKSGMIYWDQNKKPPTAWKNYRKYNSSTTLFVNLISLNNRLFLCLQSSYFIRGQKGNLSYSQFEHSTGIDRRRSHEIAFSR